MTLSVWAQTLNPEPLERLVEEAIARGDTAGAVVLVGQGERVLYHQAFGHRQLEPTPLPMAKDTVFDLASLTKPLATATAVMWLVQEKKLTPQTRPSQHLPGVDPRLTVEHLLLHRGGLVPDNPLSDFEQGPERAWERTLACRPEVEPGQEFRYTDVGYLMLQKLVETIDGRSLDRLCAEEFWRPLGMTSTGFGARGSNIALNHGRPPGQVHDPRAQLLGGVAGHAGLFSTAEDLSRFARTLLGSTSGPLSPETLDLMMQPRGDRTYGFDVDSPFATARGSRFSIETSCGHTGFTGTSLWLDRPSGVYLILLCNRLHPDNEGSVVGLRGDLATNVANQLLGPPVKLGIGRLCQTNFEILRGQRVGLITNHTGLDREGRRTVDLLHQAREVELTTLFSPEHGLSGKHDSAIDDSVDEATGLTVRSLYGKSKRPDPALLKDLDVLVFDIQDAGCRFYTFISTMLYAMEAAGDAGVRFVVLDRPNPLGGERVEGWLASPDQLDFIACWPLPLVHGMTVGELARLFNQKLDIKLEVVPMEGWDRSMTWDQTGLTWVAPSPNLRSLVQAELYPAIGLLEWGNVSVGRGTDTPFQLFGAPWIPDERQLAWDLNNLALPGARFLPRVFTPEASVFAGQTCRGVEVMLLERSSFSPALSGIQIAGYLSQNFPKNFKRVKLSRHIANTEVLEQLEKADWERPLREFLERRSEVLLYPRASGR